MASDTPKRFNALLGGILGIVFLVAAIAAAMFLLGGRNGPEHDLRRLTSGIIGWVDRSTLSEDEKRRTKAELSRIRERLKSGLTNPDERMALVERLKTAPLFAFMALEIFRLEIQQEDRVPDEEKRGFLRSLDRMERGLSEGSIGVDEIEDVVERIRYGAYREGDARAGIASLAGEIEELVDAKEVPTGAYALDFPKETRKAVDLILGENSGAITP